MTPRRLAIAPDLALPLDAVTRRLAILAMSGAGKSNLAVRLAEEMSAAGLPWVAIDPKGDWYGLRSNAAGDGPGLPIPVLGGLHGDIPLEPTAGRLVGELLAERRLTCVLDVSEFERRQELFRFLADLGETLYRRNRDPLHLFLEEADEYLPQRPAEKGELPRCLGVWQRLVKRGRFRGLGSTQITQRNAALNKDTLYMAEAIFVLRATGKADREAVRGWVEYHAASPAIVDSLPTLEDGEGWVSSPAWLRRTARVRFLRRQTFDSGATPAEGRARPPATLADVDLAAIQIQMAATIERATAEDPKALRARIAALEAALRQARAAPPRADPKAIERAWEQGARETRSLLEGQARAYEHRLERAARETSRLLTDVAGLDSLLREVAPKAPAEAPGSARTARIRAEQAGGSGRPLREVLRKPTAVMVSRSSPEARIVGGGALRILTILAQRAPAKLTVPQWATLAGMSRGGGTWRTYVSQLRVAGYLEEAGGLVTASEAGSAAAGEVPPAPIRPEEVRALWRAALGTGPSRLMDALVEAYPEAVSREALAERVEMTLGGGTFRTHLSKLRVNGLVEAPRDGMIRASSTLVEG